MLFNEWWNKKIMLIDTKHSIFVNNNIYYTACLSSFFFNNAFIKMLFFNSEVYYVF